MNGSDREVNLPDRLRRVVEDLPEELEPPDPASPAGRILTAAREIVVASGLEGISTRAVAEGAGVNQAMIHYYFGTKEKMIGALVRREILGILRDVIAGARSRAEDADFLERFPERLLDTIRSDMNRFRLVRRVLATDPERIARAVSELGGRGILGTSRVLLGRIDEERAAGRLPGVASRSLLLFLLTLVYGLVLLEPVARTVVGFRMEEDGDWETYRADLRVLIENGLRGGAGREEHR